MADQQVVKIQGADLVSSVLQESAIHDFEASLQGALRRPPSIIVQSPSFSNGLPLSTPSEVVVNGIEIDIK